MPSFGIVGEAGIGKSRLVFELRQRLRGEEVTYLGVDRRLDVSVGVDALARPLHFADTFCRTLRALRLDARRRADSLPIIMEYGIRPARLVELDQQRLSRGLRHAYHARGGWVIRVGDGRHG